MATKYYDTNYTFINPVRYFKANDPYYFEVDNIPIKQLEESNNFLKDQVDGLLDEVNKTEETAEIDRSGFSELKPYVVGNDRVVRVKPGRYTSRINNAYSLTPLQVVDQVFGLGNAVSGESNTWQTETNRGSYVSGILNEFTRGREGIALNMNGLFERSFVWPIDTEDGESLTTPNLLNVTNNLDYGGNLAGDDKPLYPNVIGALIKNTTEDLTRNLTLVKNLYAPTTPRFGGQQGRTESEFIKRWRGAIRTSVVDVPDELQIEIPPFVGDDFFYTNEAGDKTNVDSNVRIDLVFIYSKAVDEVDTTIAKFDSLGNVEPPKTTPVLGVLKGAGLGVSKKTSTNNLGTEDTVDLNSLDGMPLMLANPGDQTGDHIGFTTSAMGVIRGSFPSPDDLLNLAPVLSENLETDSYALIGQTILPVAYILVEKGDEIVSNEFITKDHVLDIRPFFRTTELAYNERAGLAAATPQISIANPVVTEAHLEMAKSEIYNDLKREVVNNNTPPPPGPDPDIETGIIAAGVITGGFDYGPEGALMRQRALQNTNLEDMKTSVIEEFGYYPNSVEDMPMWDHARWYLDNQGSFGTAAAADFINVGDTTFVRHGNPVAEQMPPWNGTKKNGFTSNPNFNGNLGNMGWGKAFRYHNHRGENKDLNSAFKHNEIFFVSKRINMPANPASNYHVNVNLLNCVPLTDLGSRMNEAQTHQQPAGIWLVKHPKYFIINVAWPNDGLFSKKDNGDEYDQLDAGKPWKSRNSARQFSGFMLPSFDSSLNKLDDAYDYYLSVLQDDVINNKPVNYEGMFKQSNIDTSDIEKYNAITPILYPSVTWEVIALSNSMYAKGMGPSEEVSTLSIRDGNSYINF